MSYHNLPEIDLESILIQPGDLPAGYSGAQIREQAPEMFSKLPRADVSIYQQLAKNGDAAGGITVFLYSQSEHVSKAYSLIVSGFGTSEDNSLFKKVTQPLPGIGEECTATSMEAKQPYIQNACDLAFVRSSAVVHIRMSNATEADIASYAKRLDKRLKNIS
jgi:hypothetical protein